MKLPLSNFRMPTPPRSSKLCVCVGLAGGGGGGGGEGAERWWGHREKVAGGSLGGRRDNGKPNSLKGNTEKITKNCATFWTAQRCSQRNFAFFNTFLKNLAFYLVILRSAPWETFQKILQYK